MPFREWKTTPKKSTREKWQGSVARPVFTLPFPALPENRFPLFGPEKWQGSVARPLPAPPSGANLKGFGSVFQTALRGLSNRSIVVVGNY
jgi:hypothetical protein